MFDIGGAVGAAFGAVGLLFAALGLGLGTSLLRRTLSRRAALARGLAAEAHCLDTYVTQERSMSAGPDQRMRTSSRRHVVLGFRTPDGRDIRVEDTSGVPRVVGDVVQVRYLPEHPERAVAVGPRAAGSSVALAVGLLVCAAFVCGGLLFAAMGFGIGYFSFGAGTTTVLPDPTTMP